MTLSVEVWSDFICPWCYLAATSLQKLEASHGISVSWRAYELRPKGSSAPTPEYKAKLKALEPRMKQIAQDQYGIELYQGPLGINSRPALIGLKYAQNQDTESAYHAAVFHAYWREGKNIEERSVLTDIAEAVGLDKSGFLDALDNPVYDAQVDDDVELAYRREMFSVPAMVFEKRFYIPGAQPYDELVRLVEQMQERLKLDSNT